MKNYKICLRDRSEGVEYSDDGGIYYFAAYLGKKTWNIYLPCSLNGIDHELSDDEYRRIIPRIKEYLKYIRWFGLFGFHYNVTIKREEPFDKEAYFAEEAARGCKVVRNSDGSTTVFPPKRKSILSRLLNR